MSQEAWLPRALPGRVPILEASPIPSWTPGIWGQLAAPRRQRMSPAVSAVSSEPGCPPACCSARRWAKWTRCCGRPRVRCGEQPSAWKSCQKTRERWSCQLAEGRPEGVRCLAKRGTRFTLGESSRLSEGRYSPGGQEVPRHTVLSSWENAAARCPPNQTQSGTKIDYHSKFSQDEGHFLLLVALSTRKKKQKDWSVHWLLSSLENKWEILRSKSFLCGKIVKRTEKRDVVQTCLQLFF